MMWRPEVRFDRIEQLTPPVLRRHGVDGLLLDLDETLLSSDASDLDATVRSWATSVQKAGVALAIVSNGRRDRVRRAARRLNVPGYALCGKPLPLVYRVAARRLAVAPLRCAVVGDQLFTDVLGARLAGLRPILVAPRSEGGLPHTRALRRVEAFVLGGGTRGRPDHR